MGRILSVYLPEWDTQLIQRAGKYARDEDQVRKSQSGSRGYIPRRRIQPVLLTITHNRQDLVVRYCRQAHAAGVQGNMSAAEAQALCPNALILPFDGARSQKGLERLAAWAMRFSPVIGVDHTAEDCTPHTCGLLLDITGAGHLFGGEHLMLADIATRLKRLGFSSRLAAAPTIGAAWALARFGPHAISLIAENQIPEAIRLLPVAALRLPYEIQMNLWQVGIDRVEHLLRVPREQLLVRFGDQVLRRIDQLMGIANEQIEPIRTSEPVKFRRAFDGATTQLEAVLLTIQDLLVTLTQELAIRESGVRRLSVELSREGDPPVSREILISRATRNPKHLWSLLRPKVEGLHLGYGVDAVTVTAVWVVRIDHTQDGLLEGHGSHQAEDQAMGEFLDVLTNRWGANRVLVAAPIASHTPEQAWHFKPAIEQESAKMVANTSIIAVVDRPSILLKTPEPIEAIALQPDNPPSWILWRGEEYPLAMGMGPERIVTGDGTRDYFKVQTQAGQWFWVYRQLHNSTWFLHGLWA